MNKDIDNKKVLEVKDLVKRFNKVTAVSHLNLNVYEGEIYGLLGPNGSGKSTTINCILSLLKYEQGEIKILGSEMDAKNVELKSKIGLVMQDLALYEELTAKENIDYFCSLYVNDKDKRKDLVEKAINFVGLEKFVDFKPTKLSGGLRRRLNLACGISHEPEIIFMDEPTVAVDPQSRNNILENIKQLSELGATIIYTTHYMEEVEQICDRLTIIDEGKDLVTGTPEEIKDLSQIGEVITVHAYDLSPEQIEYINKIPDINDLKYDSGKLVLHYNKGEGHLINLMHYLESEEVSILNINVSKPSLNDVFLEITGKELRDNA